MKRNKVGLLALALIVTLLASACAGAQTGAPTGQNNTPAAGDTGGTGGQAAAPGAITAVLGAVIREADQAAIDYCTEQTGVQVQVLNGPESATDRLAQYLQFFGAQSGDIDVMQIDVIWPGILAEHLVDLKPYIPEDQLAAHFQRIVENNTVDGALVGLPWFTDAGLLYYRTDLMEKYGFEGAPATWAELEQRATTIQEGERGEGKSDFWGFVWQGAAYEGLTCDALEWQVSWGGGQIVEPDGTISINNAQAASAFDMAAGWVGTISPEGVTSYKEEEARNVWQAGNAAFMRNWPYAYSLGNEEGSVIAGQYAVAPLPKGEGPDARNADTLGGWQMAVSKYSEDVDSAAKFAVCMTSREAQKIRATQGSFLPTIGDLYQDEEVLAANAFFGQLFEVFSGGAVARPSTVTAEQYNEVSTIYFTEVNRVLTGQQTGQEAVQAIEEQLQSLLQ
ncbi:MAG: ABC transporter substrate-binding protein [Caldilinea sp. CFX5]|nr:ABC transporter substrate-binding protein [Caldilinea sp. CFX5]